MFSLDDLRSGLWYPWVQLGRKERCGISVWATIGCTIISGTTTKLRKLISTRFLALD